MGVGNIISSLTTGRLLDWNYRRLSHKHDIPYQRTHQMEHSNFPIERARLQVGLPLILVTVAAVVAYGWTLRADLSPAAPIGFVFVAGYGIMGTFQVLSVLMSDHQ